MFSSDMFSLPLSLKSQDFHVLIHQSGLVNSLWLLLYCFRRLRMLSFWYRYTRDTLFRDDYSNRYLQSNSIESRVIKTVIFIIHASFIQLQGILAAILKASISFYTLL